MSEPNDPGKPDGGLNNERTVTDPVTHLPLTIHDATSTELESIPPPDEASYEKQSEEEMAEDSNRRHAGVEQVLRETTQRGWWRDPAGDTDRARVQTAMVAGMAAGGGSLATLVLWFAFGRVVGRASAFSWIDLLFAPVACTFLGIGVCVASLSFRVFQTDLSSHHAKQGNPNSNPQPTQAPDYKNTNSSDSKFQLNQNQLQQPRSQDQQNNDSKSQSTQDRPETALWLNHLFTSLWPIINPTLLTPLADMLEDALQASVPKLIHGVRVADLGQGSLPVRILAIRALEKGSAAQAKEKEGMQAEEGDFVNLELALAYRARATQAGVEGKSKSGNAHVLLEFYTPNGLVIPVWVELTGFLATVRVRTQLTPDPPFLAQTTLTLLGQPFLTLKCTPLAKHFPDVMDVPGLSHWIQNAINEAVAVYVAPRSINLDLKALLMGETPGDTEARGVLVVRVRGAWGFRMGDGGSILKTGEAKNGDAYVTVGWGKWGKPLWSTRIIQAEPHPVWDETAFLLVGPAEVHAQESLRLQLWDSDRFTADDHLGSVDVPLSSLLSPSDGFLNNLVPRTDSLASDSGKPVPGTLAWSVGYFAKTTLEQHLQNDPKMNYKEVKAKIEDEAEAKLREGGGVANGELEQQKREDLKARSDEIVAGSRPREEWPSGIVSVRIEQISGLEVQRVRESGVRGGGGDGGGGGEEQAGEEGGEEQAGEEGGEGAGDGENGGNLPSPYCTIVINQERVYKTRTKMKSDNPFFAAHTEKFIRSWPSTTLIIAVRDSRPHESNPLLGVIVLPLLDLFKHRSHFAGTLPLVGGLGYGRMTLSVTFRSVQVQLPKELRGWDTGTLDVKPRVQALGVGAEFAGCRLVMRMGTARGKGKFFPVSSGEECGEWESKHGRPVRLPVTKRYASCLVLQLRRHVLGPDQTPAFAILWLKDMPDEEEVTLELPVRRNKGGALERARVNAVDPEGEKERGQAERKEQEPEHKREQDEVVGHLRVTVRFWPGLSGYHKKMARKDRNMHDVMEVLDCAQESRDVSRGALYDEMGKEEDESELSDSDSDSGDSDGSSSSSSEEDGAGQELKERKGSLVNEVSGFRKRKSELHRKHRGLMQWSGVRKATWLGKGVGEQAEKLGEKVKDTFKHQAPDVGIDREV